MFICMQNDLQLLVIKFSDSIQKADIRKMKGRGEEKERNWRRNLADGLIKRTYFVKKVVKVSRHVHTFSTSEQACVIYLNNSSIFFILLPKFDLHLNI